MKKFIIAIVVIVAIVVAAIAFLHLTVPRTGRGVRVPLTRDQTELLAFVPSSAQSFALIPTAAAVYGKLQANPITTDAVEQWTEQHRLPQPWLMGAADLLTWNTGEGPSYAIRLDPFRAFLVRIYLMSGSEVDARWSGSTLLINAPAGNPIEQAEISRMTSLASGLPAADALVVQLEGDRGAFPPTRRPAVTSVRITATDIDLVTHAPANPAATPKPLAARYSRSAMLNAAFAAPPRVFDDLNRLFLARVSPLVSDGGAVAIYDVDTGTLLPRPKGVIILPADDARRESLQKLAHDTEGLVQTGEQNGQLLVSFDSSSIPHFTSDSFDQPRFDANLWSMRLDPQRLVPVLQRMGGSTGLRLAAGRLYRATRQLGTWIGPLQQARSIEAASSASGQTEEMHVVITSK